MAEGQGRTGTAVVDEAELATWRHKLGLKDGERPRLLYAAGPGDLYGTYQQWCRGEPDHRLPLMSYSAQMYDLAEAVGADLHVVTRSPCGPSSEDAPFVRFHEITPAPFRGGLGYFRSLAAMQWRISQLASKFKPHASIFGSDVFWPLMPFHHGEVILSVHNTFWPLDADGPQKGARLSGALIGKSVAGAVCTSESCAVQTRQLLQPGAPITTETPQAKLHMRDQGETEAPEVPTILYVGRTERAKGVFDLFEAAVSLRAKHPELRLVYVGEGGALARLRDLATGPDGGDWIEVRGRLPGDQVLAEMRNATVLCCPTRREFNEGLALVCIEANLMGVPSVVSSIVPAKDTLAEACLVFDANDVGSLTTNLERALFDPQTAGHLRRNAGGSTDRYFDRSRSWASQLFAVLTRIN